MAALPGESADSTLPIALACQPAAAPTLWRRLCSLLKAARKAKSDEEIWATALPGILELDAHILRDIGAPAWAIAQAQQRRTAPSRLLQELSDL
ncbi:hypothetical protein [Pollutimonas bauzanensis]|uniref:Uncharacterized protein n=1 Tax=Pollutimonas bauzanensis TaxID=658167 RepID=A0A1M5YR81_9BURK|nr:hypothetical protein [Pollutimonas bauzanensis]SHI14083.1 hypothetical protein SAMN04488135_11051 [Pollutimonas bauzanensis]